MIVHVDVTNIWLTCVLLTLSYGNTYGSILVTKLLTNDQGFIVEVSHLLDLGVDDAAM